MLKTAAFIASLLVSLLFLSAEAGPSAVISSVGVEGSQRFSRREIAGWSGLKTGEKLDEKTLEAGLSRILDRFEKENHFFARIDSVGRDYSTDSSRVRITIYLKEGSRMKLKSVEVVDSTGAHLPQLEGKFRRAGVFHPVDIESGAEECLELVEESGYPFAHLELQNLAFSGGREAGLLSALFEFDPGPLVTLSGVEVKGNKSTRDWIIARESRLDSGQLFSAKAFYKGRKRILNTELFEKVEPIRIIRRYDDYYALIEVKEGRHNSFDGAVGYFPGLQGEDGRWTGLVDFQFNNIFGAMRKFHLHWRQLDENSQDIALAYREPWVGGIPLDISVSLEQSVRSVSSFSSLGGGDKYITRRASLDGRYPLSEALEITGGMTYDEILPDSAAKLITGIPHSLSRGLRAGFIYDTRDNRFNPRSGVRYSSVAKVSNKKNFAQYNPQIPPEVEERRLEVDLEAAYPFSQRIVLDLKISGRQLKTEQNIIPISEMYFLGGASTVRGYREEQFAGAFIAWLNLEYRYIIGRRSRLFIFNDLGYYQRKGLPGGRQAYKFGYGAGLRLETKVGIIGVDYGLGEGDSPTEGKLHFRLRNEF